MRKITVRSLGKKGSIIGILSILMITFGTTPLVFAQSNSKSQTQVLSTSQKISSEALIEGTAVVVRIVAIRDNATAASEYTGLDKGNKFVSIQIVVDNGKGSEEWDVKPQNLKLKDAEGNVFEIDSFPKVTQPVLTEGTLDAGDLVKGWITFQVGETVSIKSLKLRYEDSGPTVKSGWIALSSVAK